MEFHRLKIRSKAMNVAKIKSRHLRLLSKEQSNLGTFLVPSPDGDSKARCCEAIILNI